MYDQSRIIINGERELESKWIKSYALCSAITDRLTTELVKYRGPSICYSSHVRSTKVLQDELSCAVYVNSKPLEIIDADDLESLHNEFLKAILNGFRLCGELNTDIERIIIDEAAEFWKANNTIKWVHGDPKRLWFGGIFCEIVWSHSMSSLELHLNFIKDDRVFKTVKIYDGPPDGRSISFIKGEIKPTRTDFLVKKWNGDNLFKVSKPILKKALSIPNSSLERYVVKRDGFGPC